MDLNVEAIHGVEIKQLKKLSDDRGFLMEILRCDDRLFSAFGQTYVTGVKRGVAKAWHYHRMQTDHFVCLGGKALVVLCDTREDSPTKGTTVEYHLHSPQESSEGLSLLTIPPYILHGFTALDCDLATILNIPDFPYNPEKPDEFRIPWNSTEAPYLWPESVTRGG